MLLVGSVLSGGGSVPKAQASAEDWINMVNDFQKGSLSTRLGIPMIYGIDAVHGNNNVYNATIFPHNIGLGATRYEFHSFYHNHTLFAFRSDKTIFIVRIQRLLFIVCLFINLLI